MNIIFRGFSIFLFGLIVSKSNADVHDRNIISGKVRTEYSQGKGTGIDGLHLWYMNNGLYGDEGCLFDASANTVFSCPGRRGVEAVWRGNTQTRVACNGDQTPIGDSWMGCLTYDTSPYFSIGNPSNSYWVVNANNDPAFDQCREGPPGLSEAIANYSIEPEKLYNIKVLNNPSPAGKMIKLKINAGAHDPYCNNNLEFEIPFISIGSHFGAGNNNYIGTMNRNEVNNPRLKFTMSRSKYRAFKCVDSQCPSNPVSAAHGGFFVIAEWAGPANPGDPSINFPKMVWVDLFSHGTLAGSVNDNGSIEWNWPIADSMFWPGAEIAVVGANQASLCQGISIPPLYSSWPHQYDIDLTKLFKCVSDNFNRFSTPMPYGNVNITGVHFFIEAANSTEGELEISLNNIRID